MLPDQTRGESMSSWDGHVVGMLAMHEAVVKSTVEA